MFKIEDLDTCGTRGVEDLCALTERLGYGRSFKQLMLNNGSALSSLSDFLQDNPGAIEALYDWIQDNFESELEEISIDEDEEY